MKTLSYLLATLLLEVSAAAASSAEPNIYVGSIEPLQQAPSGSGPLHHLAARSHSRKVNQNAATLSSDIARALSSQNARGRAVRGCTAAHGRMVGARRVLRG